ncbi:antibiotic biosynthesis monooxygenase family protein [Psychroserpens sp. BH13MA-6]
MKTTKPYYAVIFTSKHTSQIDGYDEMATQMEALAQRQKGYLGMESARDAIGITVSYWESLEAIKQWKQQTDHLVAQQKGIKDWYAWYKVRICRVERFYNFERE